VTVVILGIMPGIFVRERYKKIADTELTKKDEAQGIMVSINNFFKGFAVTFKNTSF